MICPNCGIDIERFQKEQGEKEKRAQKEVQRREKFEEENKEILQSLRRRKTISNFLLGYFLLGYFSTLLGCVMFGSLDFRTRTVSQTFTDGLLFILVLLTVAVAGGIVGYMIISRGETRKKRKLWEEFCRLHPIE